MADCDRCHVAIGWFGKRKIVFPDGRRLVVCAQCAELLGPQVEAARRALHPEAPSLFETLSAKPAPVAHDARDDCKDLNAPPPAGDGTWTVTTTYESKTATGAEGAVLARDLLAKMRAQPGLPEEALRQMEVALGRLDAGATRLDLARIVGACVQRFRDQTGIDVSNDSVAMQRISDAAKVALVKLASQDAFEVNLPYLSADATGPRHLDITLRRDDLLS